MGSTLNCEPGKLSLLFVAFLRVFGQQQEKKLRYHLEDRGWSAGVYVPLEEPPETCRTGQRSQAGEGGAEGECGKG